MGYLCERDLLKTMISRTRTMKPRTPPPVPYCHALLLTSACMGAANAREKKKNCRRVARAI